MARCVTLLRIYRDSFDELTILENRWLKNNTRYASTTADHERSQATDRGERVERERRVDYTGAQALSVSSSNRDS